MKDIKLFLFKSYNKHLKITHLNLHLMLYYDIKGISRVCMHLQREEFDVLVLN